MKRVIFWLRVTELVGLLAIGLFVILFLLGIYAIVGDSVLSDYVNDHERIAAGLLRVMRVCPWVALFSLLLHGSIGLRAFTRK